MNWKVFAVILGCVALCLFPEFQVAKADDQAAGASQGLVWTQRTLPSSQGWSSVAYGNGVFVAVANDPSAVAATSPDGITWTVRTLPSSQWWASVTYGKGVFVAVAQSSAVAATSPNGIKWKALTLPS